MELLYETFIPTLIVGSVFLFFLIAFWVVSRQKWALYAMAVPILIIVGGFLLDEMVETNQEAVWKTINAVQNAMVAGDVKTIEKYLTSDAKKTFNRYKWALDNFTIRRVGIYNMQMKFNDFTSPPTATISFEGVAKYQTKNSTDTFGDTYLDRFTVELEKENNVWLITPNVETKGFNPIK